MTLSESLQRIADTIEGHGDLVIFRDGGAWVVIWFVEDTDKSHAVGASLEAALINMARFIAR